ncbi:MAG: hypothetical protein ACK47B_15200 [Armatimonadota bacterium]
MTTRSAPLRAVARAALLAAGAVGLSAGAVPPLAAGGEPSPTATPIYEVIDLGALPETNTVIATAVNDAGFVAGYAYMHVAPGHFAELGARPFLWRNGKMTELPAPRGRRGGALAINARGDVGGHAENGKTSLPVIWRHGRGYAVEPLSELHGAVTALADDGSAAGDVGERSKYRAFLWAGGQFRILGAPQDVGSRASDLNEAGTVVGSYVPAGRLGGGLTPEPEPRAAMWSDGRRIPLLQLAGEESACLAINDRGVAVGWYGPWDRRRACVWEEGKVTALPGPDDCEIQARAINRAGVIVGDVMGPGRRFASLWRDGELQDLNDLIPGNSGWLLLAATGISDSGLIVGYGSYEKYRTQSLDSSTEAFLLRPRKR